MSVESTTTKRTFISYLISRIVDHLIKQDEKIVENREKQKKLILDITDSHTYTFIAAVVSCTKSTKKQGGQHPGMG